MSIPRIPKDISCECGCQQVHFDPHAEHWEIWCPDCNTTVSEKTKAKALKAWKQEMIKKHAEYCKPIS